MNERMNKRGEERIGLLIAIGKNYLSVCLYKTNKKKVDVSAFSFAKTQKNRRRVSFERYVLFSLLREFDRFSFTKIRAFRCSIYRLLYPFDKHTYTHQLPTNRQHTLLKQVPDTSARIHLARSRRNLS